jgi:hypothetical protein
VRRRPRSRWARAGKVELEPCSKVASLSPLRWSNGRRIVWRPREGEGKADSEALAHGGVRQAGPTTCNRPCPWPATEEELRLALLAMTAMEHFVHQDLQRLIEAIELGLPSAKLLAGLAKNALERLFAGRKKAPADWLGPSGIPGSPEYEAGRVGQDLDTPGGTTHEPSHRVSRCPSRSLPPRPGRPAQARPVFNLLALVQPRVTVVPFPTSAP